MLLNIGYIALLSCSFGDTLQNVPVDTVYIQAQRAEISQIGRVKLEITSPTSPQTLQNGLMNSAVFLKQYGVSGSSTISRRGADPAQTQVLWNGLPVNNPMHGLTDFNNLSAFGLQEVFLIEGGNSALFGSGSVGGTIFLKNKLKFNQGNSSQLVLQTGQFGNNSIGINTTVSKKYKYFQFTYSYINNENRFSYFDHVEGINKIAQNSFLNQQLIRGVFGYKKLAHEFKTIIELNQGIRGLGTQIGSSQTLGNQKDYNFRSVMEYQYAASNWQWVTRMGFVQDVIKYYADGIHGDSSVAHTPYFQTELYKTWKGIRFLLGLDALYLNAYSLNYKVLNPKRFYSASILSATGKLAKTDIAGNLRFEHYEKILTFGISSVTPIHDWVKMKLNIHSSFRRPTLNDLFWNTNTTNVAVPERGWGTEMGFQKDLNLVKIQYAFEATAYYRELNNPIIWIPNGSSWIATNFYNGKYLGAQFQSRAIFPVYAAKIKLVGILDWVKTGVKKSATSDVYQQIFIPDFMGTLGATYLFKDLSIGFDVQHVGNRFIQTDNQQWLSGYRLLNLHLGISEIVISKKQKHANHKLNIQIECKNILNTNYQSMPQRAMPGRTFWFTMGLNI